MGALDTLFGGSAGILRDRGFQLLLLANVMAPLGPGLVSPLLDTLTGPFGVSTATIGLFMAAFTAPAVLVIPVAGVLADRYGRKPVLVAGLLLFGLGGAGIAFTTDFRVALALRLLQGVGGAGIVPIVITSIGDQYEGADEVTGQGLRFASSGVSQTVFPLVAGVLVVFAWQYPIALYALAIPIAAVVARWLEEPRTTAGTAGPARGGSQLGRLRAFVRRPAVAAIVAVYGLPAFLFWAFLTYVSVIVRVLGGSPAAAGAVVAVNSLVFAVASSQTGRVTAAVGNPRSPLLGALVAMGVGLAVVGLSPSLIVLGVGAVSLGAGFGLSLSLYRSLVTGLAPEDLRGSLVSLAESGLRLSATAAPVVLGLVLTVARPALGDVVGLRWTIVGAAVAATAVGVGVVATNPLLDAAE